MSLLPYRVTLSLKWLLDRLGGGAAHVPASQIWHSLVQTPNGRRGLPYIDSIGPAPGPGDFLEIRLSGHAKPLYWPAEMDRENMSGIVAEQMEPGHWHNYVTEWTPLGPDDVAVDCGAAEGLFGFLNAGRCRRVVLFEPNRRFVDACERTFAGWGNVDVMPCALGSKAGKASFQLIGTASRLGEGGEVEVDVRTFDEVAAEMALPISFIKADLEGAELDFLAGARETIARHKPKLAITTYHDPSHAREIERFLKELCPEYKIRWKGYVGKDWPLMLHAWV